MEATKKRSGFWTSVIKGSIYSIVCSLILILIFALIIRFFDISNSFIMPVNQIIKIISLFVGCLLSLMGSSMGLRKGLLIGIIYSIFSYLIFSFISGNFNFSYNVIIDLIFASLIAGICGMIAVNIKK